MLAFIKKYAAFFTILMATVMVLARAGGAYAQTDTTLPTICNDTICLVADINITGNKKTKQKIILCELEFEPGDTISLKRLPEVLEKSEVNLQKTSIFNYVTITYTTQDSIQAGLNCINVDINVEECWYTWPRFDLSPHTGNLNDWFAHPDFDLIDYYIGIKKYNFLGRRQSIGLYFRRGFNNITQLTYENIAIDRKHKHLISLYASIQQQNNLMINTENDKAKYCDFDGKRKAMRGYTYNLSYKHRPTIDMYNIFTVGYMSVKIRDSVAMVNPEYLGRGKTQVEGVTLSYEFKLDKRSSSYYPLKGSFLSTSINKYGVFSNSIDIFKLNLDVRKYMQLADRQYFAAQFYGSMSSNSIPFFKMEAIGFKPNIVPGYEHNMIKGRCVSYLKTSYKYELIRQRIVHLKWLPFKKFNKIHYAVYVNAFANAGYTTSEDDDVILHNTMSGSLLAAGGIGIDFVTYYDRVFSAFVTRNIQGNMYIGVGFKSSF